MDDLITWLRAQLDRQERYARKASPGPWKANAEHDEVIAVDDLVLADGFALNEPQLRATVDHIVENDPDRVLREVEAKRRIIEAAVVAWNESCNPTDDFWVSIVPTLKAVVRNLAMPYCDRPGYRDEWRPAT